MGWFSPRCPVTDEEKLWLENAANWLIGELGLEYVREIPVILPNQDFFPDPFHGTETDVEVLLKRVCSFVKIDSKQLDLKFYHDRQNQTRCGQFVHLRHSGGGTAGYYEDDSGLFTIGIELSQLNNHVALVGTMAHELGHVILLGEKRISPEQPDHEFLTDLLTVFLGMGIFTANSAIMVETNSCGWKAQKHGYLTEEMYGYALALFAHIRDERKPDWAKYLNTNVKSYFKNSFKFIEKNGMGLVLQTQ